MCPPGSASPRPSEPPGARASCSRTRSPATSSRATRPWPPPTSPIRSSSRDRPETRGGAVRGDEAGAPELASLDVPTLVIHGGADTLVPTHLSEPLARLPAWSAGSWPNLRHETLNEPEGPEVVARDRRLAACPSGGKPGPEIASIGTLSPRSRTGARTQGSVTIPAMTAEIRIVPEDRFAELIKTAEIAFGEDLSDDLIARIEKVADKAALPVRDRPRSFRRHIRGLHSAPERARRGSCRGRHHLRHGPALASPPRPHERHDAGDDRRLPSPWRADRDALGGRGCHLPAVRFRLGDRLRQPRRRRLRAITFTRDWPREGSVRLVPAGEGAELDRARLRGCPIGRSGFLVRDERWWLGVLPDPEKDKKGGEARRLAVYRGRRRRRGVRRLQDQGRVERAGPASLLTVEEAMGCHPRGTREIWRFLFEVDLVRNAQDLAAADRPPALLARRGAAPAREQPSATACGSGSWTSPPLSKPARYGLDGHGRGQLTFDLADTYCPWNAGRWKPGGLGRSGAREPLDGRRSRSGAGRQRPGVALPGRLRRDRARGRRTGRGTQARAVYRQPTGCSGRLFRRGARRSSAGRRSPGRSLPRTSARSEPAADCPTARRRRKASVRPR